MRLKLLAAAAAMPAIMSLLSLSAQDKIIFTEDFRDQSGFSKRWRNCSAPGKSTYEPGPDGLTVMIRPNPFNDGYIEYQIPLIKRGMLDFDMEYPNPAAAAGGIGLFVEIYNITTFFHAACRDWRAYFPEPESKRIEAFNIEPVGHRKITNVTPKGKSHYRIYFDQRKDRVEFFRDDMSDPVYIQGGVSIFGHSFFRGGKIRIGSMGWAVSPFPCRISNLKLTELKDQEITDAKRNGVILLQGITFDELRIFEALTANGIKPGVIGRYTLSPVGHSAIIVNRLKYDKMPGESRLKNAELIVLADAPAGPDGILPDFILNDMADFVRNGGRLVIFGGFFTLEKGEFRKTSLAQVLPVELKDPWTTLDFKKPMPLKSTARKFQWIEQRAKSFIVRLIHDLKVKPGAEVKLTAGGKPVLVEWKNGKGSVAVFLGMKAGKGFLYTDHPDWSKLVGQICKGE